MGDIADMMLEGILCEGCGVYLDGTGYGVARRCNSCRKGTALDVVYNPVGPIAKSQLRWLEVALERTDKPIGMYPGIYVEAAPGQIRKLIKRGLLEIYEPHNSVHKTRATITDLGRAALAERKA